MSKNMRLLKILLVLLLFTFPMGELIRINLGNNIYIKPLDFFSSLILLATTVLYVKEKGYRRNLHWYYFLFPIIGFISLLINSFWLKQTELFVSFLYLLRWVSYLSIFFAIIQLDSQFIKKLKGFLIADGIVVLIIGYLQFFFYPALQNMFYQGWDNHLYRLFGSFLDPNFVGAFFVLYILFVCNFIFSINKKYKAKFILLCLLIISTFIAIFLTFSRSALLMLITSGLIFFILLQKKKYIFYLLFAIGIFILLASPFFYLENINLFRLHSTLQRVGDLEKGITIFKDHPLIGVGFNSYRYAQIAYRFESSVPPNPTLSASGNTNSYLFILATTGVIGFAAYCYLWFRLFKRANLRKNIYSVIFLSSASGLFINSIFNNSLFYPEIMVWMWLITGLFFEKS